MNIQRLTGFIIAAGFALSVTSSHGAENEALKSGLKPLLTIKAYTGGGQGKGVGRMFFSPDGTMLATAGEKHIRLWEVKTGKLLRETTVKYDHDGKGMMLDGNVRLYGFLNDGQWLACSSGTDHEILWLDVKSLAIKHTIPRMHPEGNFWSGVASKDGKVFFTIDSRKHLTVFDGTTGKVNWQRDFSKFKDLSFPAVSADGKYLTIGENQSEATVWFFDNRKGEELFKLSDLRGTKSLISGGVVFSPDGRSFLSAVRGETEVSLIEARKNGKTRVFVWDKGPPTDPDEKKDLTRYSYPLQVAFSPDGKTALAGCGDGRLRLWEVATGGLWADLPVKAAPFAFSHDGSILATAHVEGGEIHLWDWHHSFREEAAPLSEEAGKRLWNELRSNNTATARQAMAKLLADPKQAIVQLKQLERVEPVSADELAQLIKELNNSRFTEREKAEKQLALLRGAAASSLRRAVEKPASKDTEVRLNRLLEALDNLSEDDLHVTRAVELLERLHNKEAKQLLERLAGGAEGAFITNQANDALQRFKSAR